MKTIFVHHRSVHHASNSGYSRLIDFYNNAHVVEGKPVIPYKLAQTIAKMSYKKSGLYNVASVFKELELYKVLKKNKSDAKLVHYLNAERDIRYIVKMSKLFNKPIFCGTFHKPPKVLDRLIKDTNFIEKLHGAIAVGENQVEYLQNRFNINKVKYIPHGVDTHFFNPKRHVNKEPIMLFVGQHLRDFETFNRAIPRIAERIKNLKVHVVMGKHFLKLIKPQSYIQCFSELNDMELRQKYQEATLLFLPMMDSTACNSILEAMACGLPVVTTDVGGNKGYLSGTDSILAPFEDYDYLIDATIDLLKDENILEKIGTKNRQKALEYDWQKISNEISNFHESLYIN